jgi:hypothetical protein
MKMTAKQNPTKLVEVIEKMGSGLEQFTEDAGKKLASLEDRLGTI